MPYAHEHPAVQAKLLELLKVVVAREGTEGAAAAILHRGQSLVSGMLAGKKPISPHTALILAHETGYDLQAIYASPADAKPSAQKREEPPSPSPGPAAAREPKEAEIALAEACARNAARVSARDFLAALDLVRAGELMLTGDGNRERAVLNASRILGAVSRVRRSGSPVVVREILSGVLDEDDEGRRQLGELGAEPPPAPVRTPPRGLPSVPKPPAPKG